MKRSYWLIIGAGVLWGCISLFYKLIAKDGLSPLQAVTLRVFTAAVIYSLYLLASDRQAFRIALKDIPLFLGTGILSLAAFNFCYFTAIEMSSVAVAAVLLYTAPAFVMIISALVFREKITPRKTAALVLTFIGCMLVTGALGGGEKVTAAAVLFGVGSGLGYALYTIFGKLALKKYRTETITVYTFIFAFIGVAPFAGFTAETFSRMTGYSVFGALGIGILCCVLPYILYTKGLSGIAAGKAAIIATVEPVVAAIIGAAVFHEPVTVTKTLGVVIVIAAIVLLNARKGRETS